MTEVTQTIFGRGPDHGEECGNCMQAALASVLDLPLDEVPHFLKDGPAVDWVTPMQAWLLERTGTQLLTVTAFEPTAQQPMPDVFHLIIGRTARNSDHVVVGRGGRQVWDPHPNRTGLSEPQYFEVFMAAEPRVRRTDDVLHACRQAVAHIARQIQENPDYAYLLGWGTQSFALVARACAATEDRPLEDVERYLQRDCQPTYRRRRAEVLDLRDRLHHLQSLVDDCDDCQEKSARERA